MLQVAGMNRPDEVPDMCETPNVCKSAEVEAPLCGYCTEMLYHARERSILLEALGQVEELRSDFAEKGVTQNELDEKVESEFENAFERHAENWLESLHGENGIITQGALEEALRDFEREHEDDIDNAVERSIEDSNLVAERDLERACEMLERELRGEIEELQSNLTALQLAQPQTFAERLRWLFTGVVRRDNTPQEPHDPQEDYRNEKAERGL